MDLAWGYGTDTRQRGENQDCHGVFQFSNCTLFVVCDGMGGHAGGAQASALAVRTIYDTIKEKEESPIRTALAEAIRKANRTIYETGRKSHRLQGMGTTVVAAAVHDGVAHVAHVGDSRVLLVRQGKIEALTRDHTMVNMFVDHDLLSPEDAASHPEAHVLARSLGVERQVDIEFHEPIEMAEDDVLILCSDGVHGVVSEADMGALDWTNPQAGADTLLRLVADADGTDNATLVSVTFGGAANGSAGVTEPPPAERIEDHLTPSSQGPIRTPTLLNEPQPPALFAVDPTEATPPFAPRNEAEPTEDGPDNTAPEKDTSDQDLRKSKRDNKETDAPPSEKKKRSSLVSTAGILLMLGATGLVVGLMLMNLDSLPGVPKQGSDSEGSESETTEVATASDDETEDATSRTTRVEAVVEPVEEPIAAETLSWYSPTQRPEAAIRTRPSQYTNPAPGGNHSKLIVESARNGECSESLSRLETALAESSDYAILYKKVWRCYTYSHQKPLKANVNSWKEMRALVPHFQGNSVVDPTNTSEDNPYWFRAPSGGIEQRLEAWNRSSLGDGLMGDVVRDHFSQEVVATNLANDLLIEASAALALSRVQNPPDEVVHWWARRIYFAGKFWDRPAGQIVRLYQPAAVDSFEQMLNEASRGLLVAWQKSGITHDATKIDERWKSVVQSVGLPLEVGEAYLVAKGLIPPPDTRVKKPSAAQLREIERQRAARGTGAPTGEVDQSIMNESRTWNKHNRATRRE